MRFKEKFVVAYELLDRKFREQFEFHLKDLSVDKLTEYFYHPKDPSSLAVTRILFGLAMLFDIPDERGGAVMDIRWGNPEICHFPLLPHIKAIPLPYMAVVYAVMWFGALGIMLGYKYHISAPAFTVCYWYLLLVEKSFWNNHSYLFGLVAMLLTCTQANCYWSLDAHFDSKISKASVPYWNYFILKYQFFVLYFFAGLKKGTAEWLTGYSVQNLSEHWVFYPFKLFLTVAQTDYLIVHWFVFVFDLTVAIWMIWARTRHLAMVFCALFHLMNSRLFRIGMFPWVCLATMPLFYPFDWPKKVFTFARENIFEIKKTFSNDIPYNKINNVHAKDVDYDECTDGSENDNEENNEVFHEESTRDNETNKSTGKRKLHYVSQLDSENVSEENNEMFNEETNRENETDKQKLHHVSQLHSENVSEENEVFYEESSKTNETDKSLGKQKLNILSQLNAEVENPMNDSTKGVELNKTKQDTELSDAIENTKIVPFKHDLNHKRRRCITYIIIIYVLTQAFLPYSHFITKGYNNWTNGLYGYSWDMMVHSWEAHNVVIKVVDNDLNQSFYLDPYAYTLNERWTRHGDMVYQYAHCIKDNIEASQRTRGIKNQFKNISIHIDIWCSMNGRFVQRMFDYKTDLLQAKWSPFEETTFLMPLLDEATHWRNELDKIREDVHSWNNKSDVVFIADFPGYVMEKFIPIELENVSLTVLEGHLVYEHEVSPKLIGKSYELNTAENIKIDSGLFHKILNIGEKPAFYMYTFQNSTSNTLVKEDKLKPKLPIRQELLWRFQNMFLFGNLVVQNIIRVFFRLSVSLGI